MKRPPRPSIFSPISLLLGILSGACLHAALPHAQPFAPRSGDASAPTFTALPPEHTGIAQTNAYDDPRMWAERHTEYAIGAMGSGIAVGDFDHDGRPDLFINSKLESGRLYRNLGDFRFEDVTTAAGVGDDSGEWKQGAAFVDVDNDGWLDLYVCRFGAPNQLFINQRDGTFREEAAARGVAVVDASGMANFADYDRDGWIDFYLQTNLYDARTSIAGQPDRLFRNRGDGTFTEVTAAAGLSTAPSQGHSATWWDYDEDGFLDLYVANDFSPPDHLYRNNGDGTFTDVIDESVPHTPFSSMGSDLGDVNNDGHIDLFVADMAGTTYEFTQRGLADTRSQQDPAQNEDRSTAAQQLSNVLYLGTGSRRVLEAAHLAGLEGTDWTWSPRFADLDNDGDLDLFITNGMDREQNNLDLIERKLTTANLYDRIRLTKASPVLRQRNLVYANHGDLQFEDVGAAWGLDHLGVSFGSALADFDNDGDLDLVYVNFQGPPTVLRNDAPTGNAVIIDLRGGGQNRYGLGVRVELVTASGTQVRQLTSARGYLSTSEPALHFGLGADERIETLRVYWQANAPDEFHDLSANHRYTVTGTTTPGTADVPVGPPQPLFTTTSARLNLAITQPEESREGTVDQPLLPFRFNRRGPALAVGDINGDGTDELFFGATTQRGLRLAWLTGERYQYPDLGPLGTPPPINAGPVLVFDANGDGADDLLLTAGGAALPAEEPEYEPQLWLNRGNGGLDPAPAGFLPSLPLSVGAAVAADFDRDGRLDLFLGARLFPGYYPEAPTSALLLQRDDRLADVTDTFAPDLRAPGLVTSALASDIDADGWIDLIVALEWGEVRCFRNEQGQRLVDATRELGFDRAGTGLWSSLASADFNADGRPDYVLGNHGRNSLLRASPAQPLHLFSGRFARRGDPQLVLAIWDQDRLVPVLSRNELARAITEVRRRFPSNDRYAAASLTEILGADALAAATVYRATELRSGVLLSQPDGRYTFTPLPPLAQLAPLQGMATGDFDHDGHTDLLFAANDYAPIPAVGSFDSSLGGLLRGDGQGGFTFMPSFDSGISIPGAARALALTDFNRDGFADAVVTRNDATTLAFRATSPANSRPLAVRLHGRGGNPHAIGAAVSLVVKGQTQQRFEIHAGSGQISQSTSTVFFALPIDLPADAHLQIRWPSGTTVNVPLPATGPYLDLHE
ncbi:FG-GAP-like repeat-containing protein [Actomonas aquatica]|uniref:FG-GAP-like repeat-containing protein n=1 Tax=Actomonas aquatica TaxID=2866162 RepID=A0ABZ1C6H8_9BACT|nr:FG-GAP-like repeat-containing protein [Opitutus sp. WL0086]WRQ87326.1 FG-GAP-like repeat-containing protein [Opitutus sp. WL0086]